MEAGGDNSDPPDQWLPLEIMVTPRDDDNSPEELPLAVVCIWGGGGSGEGVDGCSRGRGGGHRAMGWGGAK